MKLNKDIPFFVKDLGVRDERKKLSSQKKVQIVQAIKKHALPKRVPIFPLTSVHQTGLNRKIRKA